MEKLRNSAKITIWVFWLHWDHEDIHPMPKSCCSCWRVYLIYCCYSGIEEKANRWGVWDIKGGGMGCDWVLYLVNWWKLHTYPCTLLFKLDMTLPTSLPTTALDITFPYINPMNFKVELKKYFYYSRTIVPQRTRSWDQSRRANKLYTTVPLST